MPLRKKYHYPLKIYYQPTKVCLNLQVYSQLELQIFYLCTPITISEHLKFWSRMYEVHNFDTLLQTTRAPLHIYAS